GQVGALGVVAARSAFGEGQGVRARGVGDLGNGVRPYERIFVYRALVALGQYRTHLSVRQLALQVAHGEAVGAQVSRFYEFPTADVLEELEMAIPYIERNGG